MNKYGTLEDGKLVYPSFKEEIHVAKETIPIANAPVVIGIDFGLTPAAVFGQRLPSGKWNIVGELVCFDMGISRFSDLLRVEINKRFGNLDIEIWGDPAGDFRAQTDERTAFMVMRQHNIIAKPAPSNDVSLRIESVETTINRLVDGEPAFLIDKSCQNLKKGFNGGYHYRRIQTSGDRYDDKPNKNRYSHVHDALQYLMMGAGEGRKLIAGNKTGHTHIAKQNWDIFKTKPKKSTWDFLRKSG
tara:strand:- start:1162 stop:1893 length:732 start_codon:yes stop_codon:yes gene_type:complete